MKQYDSYKNSGVQWIGEIPSHWTSVPIKYSVRSPHNCFIDGDWIESNVIVSDGIRYLTTGNVGALKYKEQGNGFISEETFKKLQCSEVFPGDLLISRLNEPIGRTCIVPDLGYRIVVAVDNVIYRPDERLYDKQFLVYQMNCRPYADNANFIARGSTMSRVSRTTLGQFKIIVPPLPEQQAIATYLDKKCGEIDRAIATQQKRIELLQELRQNIITHAVTRGINPDASFKNSGVEWIGEVPEHWEVKRLKHICDINGRVGYRGYTTADLVPEGEGAYTIGGKHITNNVLNLTDAEYISWVKYYESPEIMVKKGDIVTAQRGSLGKTAIVRKEIGEATINPSLVLLNNIKIFNEYLYWYMVSTPVLIAIELLNTSTAVPMVSQWQISNINIPVPPIEEQQAIVAHIESETAKLDKQVAKANRQISLLQELKQSIITEVVTGKRKVC
jgi:type I restriction enzyme S subunit